MDAINQERLDVKEMRFKEDKDLGHPDGSV